MKELIRFQVSYSVARVHLRQPILVLGVVNGRFRGEHGWTQCRRHVATRMLRVYRVLVSERHLVLTQFRRLHHRLRRLVLPLHRVSSAPILSVQ